MTTQKRITLYERAINMARSYGCFEDDEVKRVAKHIFAKELVKGATIGRVNGKIVKLSAPHKNAKIKTPKRSIISD